MMKIKQKLDYVEGDFDTDKDRLICVANKKYMSVSLCFAGSTNIEFARIKLHSKDLYVDANEVFYDASELGEEICRRWNMYGSKTWQTLRSGREWR